MNVAAKATCEHLGHVRGGGENAVCYTCTWAQPGRVVVPKPPPGPRREVPQTQIHIYVDPALPGGDRTSYRCKINGGITFLEEWQYKAIYTFIMKGRIGA